MQRRISKMQRIAYVRCVLVLRRWMRHKLCCATTVRWWLGGLHYCIQVLQKRVQRKMIFGHNFKRTGTPNTVQSMCFLEMCCWNWLKNRVLGQRRLLIIRHLLYPLLLDFKISLFKVIVLNLVDFQRIFKRAPSETDDRLARLARQLPISYIAN